MNPSDIELLKQAEEALQNASSASGAAASATWWSTTNAMTMCSVLLLFSVVVLGLSTYLLKSGKSGAMVLRVFGTVLVITMATFLVVAGYDNEQLGAPLGLLGTIAGYLLGKDATSATGRAAGDDVRD